MRNDNNIVFVSADDDVERWPHEDAHKLLVSVVQQNADIVRANCRIVQNLTTIICTVRRHDDSNGQCEDGKGIYDDDAS